MIDNLHEGKKSTAKAHELGLEYMGFGRWGKNGKAIAKSNKNDELVYLDGSKKFTVASHNKHYGLGQHKPGKKTNKLANYLSKKVTFISPKHPMLSAGDTSKLAIANKATEYVSPEKTYNDAVNVTDGIFDKLSNISVATKYGKPDEYHLHLSDYVRQAVLRRLNGKESNYHLDTTEQNVFKTYGLGNSEIEDMNYYFYELVSKKMGGSPEKTDSKDSEIENKALAATYKIFDNVNIDFHLKPLHVQMPLGTFIAQQLKAHAIAGDSTMNKSIYEFTKKIYKLNLKQRIGLFTGFNEQLAEIRGMPYFKDKPPEKINPIKIPAVLDKKLMHHPIGTIIDGFKLDGGKTIAGQRLFDYLQANVDYTNSPNVKKKLHQYGVKKADLPKFLGVMNHISDRGYCEGGNDPYTEWQLKKQGIKLPKTGQLSTIKDEILNNIWGTNTYNKNLLKLGVKGQKTLLSGQVAHHDFNEDGKVWSAMPTLQQRKSMKIFNHTESKKQSEWRYKYLDENTRNKLRDVQVQWQSGSQHHDLKSERKSRNKFLNDTMKGPPPVVLRVKGFLERGMSMSKLDAEKFLKNFKVGQNTLLPPCGFSANPTTARGFSVGGDVSIVMRLKPKNGKTYGLALPHANWGTDMGGEGKPIKVSDNQYNAAMTKYHAGKMNFAQWNKIYNAYFGIAGDSGGYNNKGKIETFYDDENEIIRPGWAKNKVIAVNRIIDTDKYNTELNSVRFEIILQEMGKGIKQKLVESAEPKESESDKEKLERLQVLIKHTNGSIHSSNDHDIDKLVRGVINDKSNS